ncbi:MAG: DJ-1/PfpI family protein [Verrucomicrobia bacterium]|nr:DJ-1/PfpI family protein [Verrucomicrobiota bacterium]MBU1735294.1 DJ-1/PfpI family protein [Verrucomicrobiota bacterium]MBU1856147.1 DJ-1/PfpI family protein [Verrucomicrobiota bacterium]
MNVLMPVADGSEEMEIVIVADTFRRAKWNVAIVGLGAGTIRASRGVRLVPDVAWADVTPESFDMLVIPGGWDGVMAMTKDERLLATVRTFMANGKWLAAICAGPLLLQAAGVLKGRRVTCHPGVAGELTQTSRLNDRVVVDGRLITSQAPGTAFEFALALIRAVEGDRKADELAKSMVVKP